MPKNLWSKSLLHPVGQYNLLLARCDLKRSEKNFRENYYSARTNSAKKNTNVQRKNMNVQEIAIITKLTKNLRSKEE